MKTGIELIAAERARQISEEGWTPEHDDTHDKDELVRAAAVYALAYVHKRTPLRIRRKILILADGVWPWDADSFPSPDDDRLREKAGALLAADIDRTQRVKAGEGDPDPDERRCRECGCTDNDCSGCVARTSEPCHWVEEDLCSACADLKGWMVAAVEVPADDSVKLAIDISWPTGDEPARWLARFDGEDWIVPNGRVVFVTHWRDLPPPPDVDN
ncbi:hypothetical protein [Ruficoccus sp. ZRK36]|uniref:hypothetical protein n=1 Tax=Ruficoccus sp. ZRK36 TaxID=2866311 RepID=UPI001C72D955|nr:hypothetical protein [Ruficoccus sp. ZRK36]QYY35285.1 hypothetical protein K0V07_13410 [Ruficoccus sp. ZRK36]